LSSAEQIGGETILKLSFGHILPVVSMKILAGMSYWDRFNYKKIPFPHVAFAVFSNGGNLDTVASFPRTYF
jgi:hypothetical protein